MRGRRKHIRTSCERARAQGYRTGQPSGGAPKSSAQIPDGTTRTFNGAGGTNAYSDGISQLTINSGWDSVTRPNTILVHYIIKHD